MSKQEQKTKVKDEQILQPDQCWKTALNSPSNRVHGVPRMGRRQSSDEGCKINLPTGPPSVARYPWNNLTIAKDFCGSFFYTAGDIHDDLIKQIDPENKSFYPEYLWSDPKLGCEWENTQGTEPRSQVVTFHRADIVVRVRNIKVWSKYRKQFKIQIFDLTLEPGSAEVPIIDEMVPKSVDGVPSFGYMLPKLHRKACFYSRTFEQRATKIFDVRSVEGNSFSVQLNIEWKPNEPEDPFGEYCKVPHQLEDLRRNSDVSGSSQGSCKDQCYNDPAILTFKKSGSSSSGSSVRSLHQIERSMDLSIASSSIKQGDVAELWRRERVSDIGSSKYGQDEQSTLGTKTSRNTRSHTSDARIPMSVSSITQDSFNTMSVSSVEDDYPVVELEATLVKSPKSHGGTTIYDVTSITVQSHDKDKSGGKTKVKKGDSTKR